jgi:alcohol oxidase
MVSTNSMHGNSGPIKVSFAQDATSNIGRGFLSAAEKFDKERGPLDDTNAFFSCNGYGVRQNHSAISTISNHCLLV